MARLRKLQLALQDAVARDDPVFWNVLGGLMQPARALELVNDELQRMG